MTHFLLTTLPTTPGLFEVARDFLYSRTRPVYLRNTRDVLVFLNGHLSNLSQLRGQLHKSDLSPEEALGELYLSNRGFSTVAGHFSAVLVDLRRRTLVGITDRNCIGELYYHVGQSGHITISSHFTELLPYSQKRLNEYALACFFCLGDTEREDSLVEDIKRTTQFHTLHFGGGFAIKTVYLAYLAAIPVHTSQDTQGLLDHLELLIRNRIKGLTTEFGTLCNTLSGGVDSSYLQALLLEHQQPYSFSIAFRGSGRDNIYATDVARHLGTSHEAIEFNAKDFLANIERGIKVATKPYMYQGEAMFLKLYQHIATRFPGATIISGQTADGALDSSLPMPIQLALQHQWLPHHLLDTLLGRVHFEWRGLAAQLRAETISSDTIRRIERRTSTCQLVARYLGHSHDVYARIADLANAFSGAKEDKLAKSHLYSGEMRRIPSMLHALAESVGLKIAFPFLDPAFLEYTLGIPAKLKRKKYLGKKLAERYISSAYVHRPKIGKGIPYGDLFTQDEEWVELLRAIKKAGYYGFDVDEMIARREYLLLLRLINFHVWTRSILNAS